MLCDHFSKTSQSNICAGRYQLFLVLFHPISEQRMKILSKFVSLAISTRKIHILLTVGYWMHVKLNIIWNNWVACYRCMYFFSGRCPLVHRLVCTWQKAWSKISSSWRQMLLSFWRSCLKFHLSLHHACSLLWCKCMHQNLEVSVDMSEKCLFFKIHARLISNKSMTKAENLKISPSKNHITQDSRIKCFWLA